MTDTQAQNVLEKGVQPFDAEKWLAQLDSMTEQGDRIGHVHNLMDFERGLVYAECEKIAKKQMFDSCCAVECKDAEIIADEINIASGNERAKV